MLASIPLWLLRRPALSPLRCPARPLPPPPLLLLLTPRRWRPSPRPGPCPPAPSWRRRRLLPPLRRPPLQLRLKLGILSPDHWMQVLAGWGVGPLKLDPCRGGGDQRSISSRVEAWQKLYS